MATPTIPNGEEYFFPIIYEGNGTGQRVGKFVPFTDSGTIDNSCIFNNVTSSAGHYLRKASMSAGNQQVATFSAWIKFTGPFSTSSDLFTNNGGILEQGNGSWTSGSHFMFYQTRGRLEFYHNGSAILRTSRYLEDSSKWYHIMFALDVTQAAAADRLKIYIDGNEVTDFAVDSRSSLTQNTNLTYINASGQELNLAGMPSGNGYQDCNCYLAEVNYVDGTALGPSTFGVTDTSTGRWIPKTLSGITYGTNGFRMKFQDSSSLGDDTSGNGYDLTSNNLASTDQTTDSPTQLFATLQGTGGTLSEGNLKLVTGTSDFSHHNATLKPRSGKYYAEFTCDSMGRSEVGIASTTKLPYSANNVRLPATDDGSLAGIMWYGFNGNYIFNSSNTEIVSGTSYTTNDVIGIALDLDNLNVKFYKNNTLDETFNIPNSNYTFVAGDGATGYGGGWTANFGQKSFTYTPPTGFVALQQDNLPETDKGIVGLTHIKDRDNALNWNSYDSSNGIFNRLVLNNTESILATQGGVTRFLKGGVAVGNTGNVNNNGASFVSFNWVANSGTTSTNTDGSVTSTVQANTTAGFSIVKWTGGGSAATVGHGLSQTPEWIFYKRTSASGDGWITYHKDQNASPANGSLQIQSDGTFTSDSTLWNNTAPTSSVISIGSYGMGSGEERTAWVWHSVDGFSKFGKYVGNGNADGPFVYLGFRPAFVCIKRLTAGYHWTAKDTTRDPINPMTRDIKWNLSAADNVDANNAVDFLSNGFKIRSATSGATNYNGSGATHIYMAFAEHPFVGDGTSPVTAR